MSLSRSRKNGRRIATLRNGVEQAGRIRAVWDGKGLDGRLAAPGFYCTRLEAGERVISRRFALLR